MSVLNEELNEFMEQVVVDQSAKLVALLSVQGKTDLNTASIGEEHIASLKQTKKERQQKLDNRRQQVKVLTTMRVLILYGNIGVIREFGGRRCVILAV